MASIHDSYIGVGEETSYGTPVAPGRYLELVSESLSGVYERIESAAFRAGQTVLHSGRFEPNPKGASGNITLEGIDMTMGLLFEHALGTVASGEPDEDGLTTHTISVGDLAGKSLTVQVGRVDNTGTMRVFDYEGGKIVSWEMNNAVDGVLNINLEMDFSRENINGTPSTPSYPANSQLFTFVGGSVDIAGTSFGVSDITLSGNNALKVDRWFTTGKREPLTEGLREFNFEVQGEFEGMAHIQRIASATAAGATASLECAWASPQGGLLKVSIPLARFDAGPVNFDGAQIITHALSGRALWDGSTSPVVVEYKTKDATP